MRLNAEWVVAYRLEVVKDTPGAFEVLMGDWIDFRFSLPGSDQAGVALFIAEAKLPDGTTWKQKLKREDLMWSEVAN